MDGVKLTGDCDHEALKERLITSILQKMEGRFGDVEEGVVGATLVANLSTWPSKEEMKGT